MTRPPEPIPSQQLLISGGRWGRLLSCDDGVRRPLRLLDSQVTNTGVIIASYAPAKG
jgi:hypothetical protein